MGSSFDRTSCGEWVSIGRVKRIGERFENANCASWESRMGKQSEPNNLFDPRTEPRTEVVPNPSRFSTETVPHPCRCATLATALSHAIYAWERRLLNLFSGFQEGAVHIVLNPCRRALLAQVSRG